MKYNPISILCIFLSLVGIIALNTSLFFISNLPLELYISLLIMFTSILLMGIFYEDTLRKNIMTYRNNTKILITRDSLIDEDNTEKKIEIAINKKADYDILYKKILKAEFFPKTSKENIVWVFMCSNIQIFSYFPKCDKIFNGKIKIFNKKRNEYRDITIEEMMIESGNFHLKCCSAKEYAFNIYKNSGGSSYTMWHDGFLEEYQACEITPEEEEEWKNEK